MATNGSSAKKSFFQIEKGYIQMSPPPPLSVAKITGTKFRFCTFLFACTLVISLCLMLYWKYDVKQTQGTFTFKPMTRIKWFSTVKQIQASKDLLEDLVDNGPEARWKELLCVYSDDHSDMSKFHKWFKQARIVLPQIPKTAYRDGAPQGFTPATSKKERQRTVALMEVFRDTLWAHDYTFMLYAGTALGAYRHHGFIGWDDDVDVWIPHVHRDKIAQILHDLDPTKYKVWGTWGTFQWKFYYINSPELHTDWRWPYLDIFFYKENDTHVWDSSQCCTHHLIDDIFPVRQVPFEGVALPAPRNLPKFLTDTYGYLDKECHTNDWDHREEYFKSEPPKIIPCKSLHPYYPFVFRTEREGHVEESLRVAGKELYSIHVPKYCGD